MSKIMLLTLILMISIKIQAQRFFIVKGEVKDSIGNYLPGANIVLLSKKDTLTTITSENGSFIFKNVLEPNFEIVISLIGYKKWRKSYSNNPDSTEINLSGFILSHKISDLKEIVVRGNRPQIILKEDTLEYRIDNYKLRENAVVEDLLKRLPGIQVDIYGNISSMGQRISEVSINGRKIAINNISDLTKMFPVELLKKIQIIDNYGDYAQVTGRKTGSPDKIINLEIKNEDEVLKQLKIVSGYGTLKKYNISGLASSFRKSSQIMIIGDVNNTPNFPGTGHQSNIGLLYNKKFSTKMIVNSSVRQSNSHNYLINETFQKTIVSKGEIDNNEENNIEEVGRKFLGDVEILYDSKKYDKANLYLTFSLDNTDKRNSIQSSYSGLTTKNIVNNQNEVNNNSFLNLRITQSHKFKKNGRLLFTIFNSTFRKVDNDELKITRIKYLNGMPDSALDLRSINSSNASSLTYRLSYIEPLWRSANLELSYRVSYDYSNNNIITQWKDGQDKFNKIDSLSRKFKFLVFQNVFGASIKEEIEKWNFFLNLRGSLYQMLGEKFNNKTQGRIFLFPAIHIDNKLNNTFTLNIDYNTSQVIPSYDQLIPTRNLVNPQASVIGNPELDIMVQKELSTSLRTIFEKYIFLLNFACQIPKNKIVTNMLLVKGVDSSFNQEIHFLNANGDYSIKMNYELLKQFKETNSVSFSGDYSYNNSILYSDNLRRLSKNLIFKHSIKLNLFLTWLEFNFQTDIIINRNKFIPQETYNNYNNLNFRINPKFYLNKDFSILLDVNKQFNTGFNSNVVSNPTLLNVTIENSFQKQKFSCKLQGFNLLNEKNNITQSIIGNIITQSRSNIVGNFFLLSFVLQLNNVRK